MKKIILIVVLLAVGLGIYFVVSGKKQNVPISTPTSFNAKNASEVSVDINNFSFNSQILTIKAGTKVTWTNNDSVVHTITSDSGDLLNSRVLDLGETFSFTFNKSGSFTYHCNVHKTMKGTVIVE